MFNSWELILKAYVKKYTKHSLYQEDDEKRTIGADKALDLTKANMGVEERKWFDPVEQNILLIEGYRNNITHYYNNQLTPYIFMLLAKSTVNYADFLKKYFGKDILDDSFFIMPIGFKLPFKPELFLSSKAVSNPQLSEESREFIGRMVSVIKSLDSKKIDNSVVIGFDVLLKGIKNTSNHELIAAITSSSDEADLLVNKVISVSDDKGAQKVFISDEEFLKQYPLKYKELCEKCKAAIPGFKINKSFNICMNNIKGNKKYAFERKLDPMNSKSAQTIRYSELAVDEVKRMYSEMPNVSGTSTIQ